MDILIIEDDKIQQAVLNNLICKIRSNHSKNNIFVKNNGREALAFINSTKKK